MSWFSEIAGKAEDLLNRVDQSAATALQNKAKSLSVYNPDSPYHKQSHFSNQGSSQHSPNTAISNPSPLRSASSASSLSDRKLSLSPRKKSESDDEKLLRFLNSSDRDLGDISKAKMESSVSNVDLPVTDNEAENVYTNARTIEVKHYLEPTVSQSQPHAPKEVTQSEISIPEKLIDMPDLEGLFPDEELRSAKERALHAETEMKRMSKKLDLWNSHISGNDKVARELKEREKDMMAAMDAKDSQLAVLKVRLQEADQELARKIHIIQELQTENDQMIKEHALSAATQNKTIEAIREQLLDTENELKKNKDTSLQFQTEHMRKVDQMEEDRRHLTESYSALQKKWNELNEKTKELLLQLKHSNGNLDVLQQEYNDYKQKAQRILQSKEKLISSLKEGSLDMESTEKSEAASALLNAEVESAKQERDLLRDELGRANELTETYRSEVQELEKMSRGEMSAADERISALQARFDSEHVQREELQLQVTQLKEETEFLREDSTRAKSTFQSRVQDREIEIEKLRRQLTAKSLSSVSQDELESRLHALTENLIQKQTLVESLSTEKNSLVLQLERTERQLREAQSCGTQQHAFVGMNTNEQERKSAAVFLENPFDSALTRRVKRVYGTIDALSIRTGVFFRRYPVARMFIFIYMLFLHLWVMIVLLTYEPEVHSNIYEKSKDS